MKFLKLFGIMLNLFEILLGFRGEYCLKRFIVVYLFGTWILIKYWNFFFKEFCELDISKD